jgi:hypothetical protein
MVKTESLTPSVATGEAVDICVGVEVVAVEVVEVEVVGGGGVVAVGDGGCE